MNGSKFLYIIIIIALLAVGTWWAYGYFNGSTAEQSAVTVGLGDGTATVTDPFTSLLAGLDQITLSERSILTNSVFKDQLKDFSQNVGNRGLGRSNPFAPLGLGNLSLSRTLTINLTNTSPVTTGTPVTTASSTSDSGLDQTATGTPAGTP